MVWINSLGCYRLSYHNLTSQGLLKLKKTKRFETSQSDFQLSNQVRTLFKTWLKCQFPDGIIPFCKLFLLMLQDSFDWAKRVNLPAKVAAAVTEDPNIFWMYFGRKVAKEIDTSPMKAPAKETHMNAGFLRSRIVNTGSCLNVTAWPIPGTCLPSLCVSETRVFLTCLAAVKEKSVFGKRFTKYDILRF